MFTGLVRTSPGSLALVYNFSFSKTCDYTFDVFQNPQPPTPRRKQKEGQPQPQEGRPTQPYGGRPLFTCCSLCVTVERPLTGDGWPPTGEGRKRRIAKLGPSLGWFSCPRWRPSSPPSLPGGLPSFQPFFVGQSFS